MVLASDGLWNAMKNKEVVHFVDNIDKNVFDMDWKDDVTHRWVLCVHSFVHFRSTCDCIVAERKIRHGSQSQKIES